MFLAAFIASNIIGAIPLIIVMTVNSVKDPSILQQESDNLADLSVYGIEPNFALVLMIIPFLIGLLTVFLLMKPLHGRRFISLFNGGSGVRWGRVLTGFTIWFVLMGIYLLFSIKADPGNFTLHNTSRTLVPLVIIAFLLLPFQTTFEELLFRGYLMQGLGVSFRNRYMPLIITSILFGLMHSLNPEIKEFGFFNMMPQYVTFGLMFGLLTVMDNGIELAVGTHAANNIFLSIFLTHESSTLQTAALYEQHEVFVWKEYYYFLVAAIIFIALLSWIYKWSVKDSKGMKIDLP